MANSTLEDYYMLASVRNWEQLINIYETYFHREGRGEEQWIFRGQGSSRWGLQSSLDRTLATFVINQSEASRLEQGLLRRFKRQCYHYITDTPQEHDDLEWLALMQHHGAPTRLLDWTYSFFVALYFAVEDADKCSRAVAVWAFNTEWMKKPFEALLSSYPDARSCWKDDEAILQACTFKKLFLRHGPIPLVGAVTPRRMNERLTIQQGTFLCPGDVKQTFAENIISLLSKGKSESKANFVKLVIYMDMQTRKDILLRLQHMNMNRASLFPGLDGFASSLKTLMVFPRILLHPGYGKA